MRSLLVRRAPGVVGVLVEVGLVGVALLANLLARWLTLDEVEAAVADAHRLLSLEQTLRLDWEHASQDAVEATSWLGSFASWFYVWGYLPVVAGALVVLFVRFPRDYARLRNALLAAGIVGLPVYVLYPLAPPRLTDLGYTDTVSTSLVEAAARPVGIANEIAAMPSFHVGYLVVVSAVVWRLTRTWWVRAWCVLHPLAMCWVVLATGNHWVLDLPAGFALAVVGLAVAGWIERRFGRHAGPTGPAATSGGRSRARPKDPARLVQGPCPSPPPRGTLLERSRRALGEPGSHPRGSRWTSVEGTSSRHPPSRAASCWWTATPQQRWLLPGSSRSGSIRSPSRRS